MQTTTNDRTSSNGTSGYQGTEQGQPVAGQERNRKTRASRKAPAAVEPTKRRAAAMVPAAPRLALTITITLGIGIPALTLALTTAAGRLALAGHYGLAAALVGVGCTVLAVSLSHLAWAIQDITRSARWASWALAVAVDVSVVLSEAVQVLAPDVTDGLALGIMGTVTVASMALNVWAFLRHR